MLSKNYTTFVGWIEEQREKLTKSYKKDERKLESIIIISYLK